MEGLERDEARVQRHADGQGVMEGHAPVPLLRLEVEAVGGEILDKAGRGPPVTRERCAEVSRGENHPSGYVQGDQLYGQSRGEDRRGGLGVHVDVELGGGGDIAGHRHGSAHHDDPGSLGQAPAVTLERQGDIGQRSEGDDHETPGEAISRLENQIGPVQHLKGMRGLWVAKPTVRLTEATEVSETVVTVEMGRGDQRADQRAGGAPGHARALVGARHVEDAESVGGAEVDPDVARHRGDGLHGDLGRAEGQQDGEGVVDAGIGVDENGSGQLTPRYVLRIISDGGHSIERRRIG